MKTNAALLGDDELFRRVASIVHFVSGAPLDRIRREANLNDDLGICGDDGYELIETLDEHFVMDWSGFDRGVHFGAEGIGAPLPWQVSRSPNYFQRQPLTVAHLMAALKAGRWPGSPRIPRPRRARAGLYAASWMQFGIVIGGAVLLLASPTMQWLEG